MEALLAAVLTAIVVGGIPDPASRQISTTGPLTPSPVRGADRT